MKLLRTSRCLGLCLILSALAAGDASATTTVGTLPRVASTNPTLCVERVAPGELTVFSTLTVPPGDVGKVATIFLGAMIDNNLFLSDGSKFVLYTGGPLPAFQTNHTLVPTERFLLVGSINAPEGVYKVGSGYQIGNGPIVFGAYTLKVTSQTGPLDVCARPSPSQAASAVILAAGGSVSATAADGTRFTLTLPADALLRDKTISLTPVTAVDGLPLSGGLVAAVQLAPEGVRLLQPATLTIERLAGFDAQAVTAFSYHEAGEEFHLYPLRDVSGSRLTVRLMHFSGYGVGNGTGADRAAQQQRTPTAAEDRANQRASGVLDEARRQGRGLSPDDLNTLEDIYKDWKQAIGDTAAGALSNEDLVDFAIDLFIAWLNGARDAGVLERFSVQELRGLLGRAIAFAIEKAHDRCVSKHDPSQAKRMSDLVLKAQKLGLDRDIPDFQSLKEKVRKCAKFDLLFHSIQNSTTSPLKTSGFVSGRVPLVLKPDLTGFQTGEGPLNYESFVFTLTQLPENCTGVTTSQQGSTLTVSDFFVDLESGAEGFTTADIDPGDPMETETYICEGGSPSSQSAFWSAGWIILHEDELIPGQSKGWRISRGWMRGVSPAEFAIKRYDRSKIDGEVNFSEITVLTILHTPEP